MTFITSNTKTYDWYYMYTDRNTTDLTRWGAKKTIYDPCPAGWKIPAGGRSTNDNGVWGYFPYGDNVYNFGTYGITFPAQYCGVSAWYPAPGMISNNTGKLQFSGKEGRYWTYSVWETSYSWEDSHIFTCFSFYYNDNDTSNDGSGSYGGVPGAYGNSVRCVKER